MFSVFSKKETVKPSSIVTAVHGLITRSGQKFDPKNVDLESIAGDELWRAIQNPTLQLDEIGYLGTWPMTNDAIVKFQYRSLEAPNIEVDGVQKANIIDHYCLVADFQEHMIVDSADGVVKSPGFYGSPVGWASYRFGAPDPKVVEPEPVKQELDPARNYTVLQGETIWEIARRFGIPANELIEHNDLEDPTNLPAGSSIHLPYARELKEVKQVKYEVLDVPKKMHVTKPGGSKKFSFGNVQDWADIKTTGHTVPENANVDIVAIAHVPVGDDTAAYYMDNLALGSYAETGRVAYMVGYNWQHLGEGHIEKPKPAPIVETRIAAQTTAEPAKPAVTAGMDVVVTKPSNNAYKATFKPLNDQRQAKVYLAVNTIMVHELDGRRPDRALYKNQGVKIFGTFEKDGVLYGRPVGSVDNGYWFGIPMNQLVLEDELYNTEVDLPTRVAMKSNLTFQERLVVALSKTLSQYTRLVGIFKKQKIKE